MSRTETAIGDIFFFFEEVLREGRPIKTLQMACHIGKIISKLYTYSIFTTACCSYFVANVSLGEFQ
jgi:hypothetical protein